MLAKQLLKAGCISGTVMTLGDITVQTLIEQRTSIDRWDSMRTLRWSCAGLTLHGPYFFYTFGKLDKYFGTVTTIPNVLRKTAMAQLTVFPGYLVLLFGYMGAMEGLRDPNKIQEKIRNRFPEAFAGGCVFWPVANVLNFTFVPPNLRVPYLATAGTVWNTYLSYINANGLKR